ncbi:MAG: hypothetical protein BGP04_12795 [Rhizobiales bacterium 62-17]|nr:hypothetical protein [Hyphomicrobiales bacterium]OJY02185.1 MAG: hypothetical protein BGP04_12795 [Rhizobiales bacterium 62-17]
MDSQAGWDKARTLHALDYVLSDPVFAASDSLSRFLRYIVTETLEGRSARLKAYTIALTVFGRNESFNPQTNSLVRVEAARLRRLLTLHYSRNPGASPIEIQLPKGSYVPQFIARQNSSLPSHALQPANQPTIGNRWKHPRSAFVALAAILLLGIASFAMPPLLSRLPADDEAETGTMAWERPPSISITPLQYDGRLVKPAQARALDVEILAALAGFDFLRVYDFGSEAQQRRTDYRLEAHASQVEGRLAIHYRLLHTATDQVIWSQAFAHLPFDFTGDVRRPLVSKVASILGRTYGIVFTDRYARMPLSDTTTIGFACIVDGYQYFNTPSLKTFQQVLDCANRTVAANPKSSLGQALKASMLIDGHLKGYVIGGTGESTIESALQAASTAVELNQHSSQAYRALFLARFYDGRFEEAFAAAKHALTLNPHSMEIRSRVGSAYILRGDFESGMKLLNEVSAIADNHAAWLEFYYFLNAYHSGDRSEAKRHAFRASVTKTPLGAIARIIALHQRGNDPAAKKWITYLESEFPEFAIDVRAALGRMQMLSAIAERLTDELEAAGLSAKRLNTAHGIR